MALGRSRTLSVRRSGRDDFSPAGRSCPASKRRAPASLERLEPRTLFAFTTPYISEFMAANTRTLADSDGQFNDWVELHNPTAATVDLSGWYLTDNADPTASKWRIPNGTTLAANARRVIFASDKNRINPAGQLHTDFKLSAGGEYLGLIMPDGVTIAHEYAPVFPEQIDDVSYGVFNDVEQYFTTPTPNAANVAGAAGVVTDTHTSVDRGFYDQPFQVEITDNTPGVTIRYTINGDKPTATTGNVYTGPIAINKTTTLCAAAFKAGFVPSDVDTQTYIFVNDVVTQTFQATVDAGLPASWNTTPADYGMDSDVIGQTGTDLFGGVYAATIRDDLKALPSLSIVLPTADMFGSNGIYTNSGSRGDAWERSTSLEMIYPDGTDGFQVNAGISIQGGAFRNHSLTKKHSFKVVFKDKWGPPKLDYPFFGPEAADVFNSLTLRANANDGWSWDSAGGRALYTRDEWTRQTALAMGDVAPHGRFMHLYINGIYWGLYNPVEEPDSSLAATYYTGDKDDWDVRDQGGATDGNLTAWNTMLGLADAIKNAPDEVARKAAYQMIQGNNPDGSDNPAFQDYLDVDNYIDYMMVNWYIGNADWPHNNWRAARLRTDTGIGTRDTGFKFFVWDAETSMGLNSDVNTNRIGAIDGVAVMMDRLRTSADFRARFADRARKFLLDGGPMSVDPSNPNYDPAHPERNPGAARLVALDNQIRQAIVAESARWGDQHREPPYTKANWSSEETTELANYYPQRTAKFIQHLKAAGLYTTIDAPTFNQNGGQIPPGFNLLMSGPAGTVYYTLDGQDPRMPDGNVLPSASVFQTGTTNLISAGSTWRYLDNGTNQGTAWTAANYSEDANWKTGNAQLGYGDGDELTLVGYGPSTTSKYITTYFRKVFAVANPALFASVKLRVLRDDGAVVHINGEPLVYSNMNQNPVPTYTTPAAGVVSGTDETTNFYEYTIPASKFVAGNNIIAVEIHQSSGDSTDISFDLDLTGTTAATPVALPNGTTTVMARSRDTGGNWSALNQAVFYTAASANASNLRITEINYHPYDQDVAHGETFTDADDYEFAELMNTSAGPISLTGVKFTLGVRFDFPEVSILAPGERVVVVKNETAFRQRYGNGPRVLGAYIGNFSNEGQLTLLYDAAGALIHSFTYNDKGDWPSTPDGAGPTLEIIDPAGDYDDPDNWRASNLTGGSPGTAPSLAAVSAFVIGDGTAQRSKIGSLTMAFDQSISLPAGSFALTRRGVAGAAGVVDVIATVQPDGRTYVLTFAAGANVVNGSLVDGIYDLAVAGIPAAARAFHRLYSDADGDGDSDNADLFAFRGSYNKSTSDPMYKSYFDADNDGDVDNADLIEVRNRRTVQFKGY